MLANALFIFTSIIVIMNVAGTILWKAVAPAKEEAKVTKKYIQPKHTQFDAIHANHLIRPCKDHKPSESNQHRITP